LIEINRKNPGLFDGKAKPDDPPADQQAGVECARPAAACFSITSVGELNTIVPFSA
jgi:hypothetical protein